MMSSDKRYIRTMQTLALTPTDLTARRRRRGQRVLLVVGVVTALALALVLFGDTIASASAAPAPSGVAEAMENLSFTPSQQTAEATYPPDTFNRDFNSGPGAWTGYQENSLLCFVRGVTCPKWDTTWEDGQPDPTWSGPLDEPRVFGASGQPGDGFLRFHGTSLAVAPCTPQAGNANWDSPLFTYDVRDAQSWRIKLDIRQSYLLAGDGHAAWGVDIVNATGRVVATAAPAQPTLPTNVWRGVEVDFDGDRFQFGEQYRIRVKVVVLHAETALSWGDIDIDNVSLAVSRGPAESQYVDCDPSQSLGEGLAMLTGQPFTACGVTEALTNEARPLLDELTNVVNTPGVSELLDRGSGAFLLIDQTTRQFAGWTMGSEALPPSDPRYLLTWVGDGTVGKVPDYLLLFAQYNLKEMPEALLTPEALMGIPEGQVGNLSQILNDPQGEVLDIDLEWSVENLTLQLETLLGPLQDPTPLTPAAVGGAVWNDTKADGIRDPDEPVVPGVPVRLLDCDDSVVVGEQVTGSDGRYLFDSVKPTFEPEAYCVEFDTGQLPTFEGYTVKHAPGSTLETDSDPDPATGRTDRIIVEPEQRTLHWDAGISALVAPPTEESGQILNGDDPSLCLTAGTSGEPALAPCLPEPVDLVQYWTYTSAQTLQVTSDSGLVCLDAGSFPAPLPENSPVALAACDGSPGQQWTRGADGSIISVPYGMCLAPANDEALDGAVAVLRTCSGVLAQQWTIVPVLATPLADWNVLVWTFVLLIAAAVLFGVVRRSRVAGALVGRPTTAP